MFARIIIFIFFLLSLSIAYAKNNSVYLFSSHAKYLKISLDNFAITNVGNLWHMGIRTIHDVEYDPQSNLFILRSSKQVKSEEAVAMPGNVPVIEFLMPSIKGEELLFRKKIEFSTEYQSIESMLIVEGLGLMVAVYDRKSKNYKTLVYELNNFNQIKSIDGYKLSNYSSYIKESNMVVSPHRNGWKEIFYLKLPDYISNKSYYKNVGEEKFFSKVLKAASQSKILVIDHTSDPSTETKAVATIYDILKNKEDSKFNLSILGNFSFVENGSQILVNEYIYVPNKYSNGEVLGTKKKYLGSLLKYSAKTGAKQNEIKLGNGGKIIAYSDKKI